MSPMTGMTTTLADTSIWIDALRSGDSWVHRALERAEFVAYTEPVLMEFLMGARTDTERLRLRRFITGGTLLPFDSASDFDAAAAISGIGRRRGLTAGKVDCLILAVAQRVDAPFVTRDRRQAELADLVGVTVI